MPKKRMGKGLGALIPADLEETILREEEPEKAAAESTDKVIVSASIYTAPVANKNERAAEMPPVAISFVEILLFISSKE